MAVLLEGVLGEDSGESRKWISRAFRLAEPETHFAARKAFLFSIRVSGFGAIRRSVEDAKPTLYLELPCAHAHT